MTRTHEGQPENPIERLKRKEREKASISSKQTKKEVCAYCGCFINDGHAYTCNRPMVAGENTKS